MKTFILILMIFLCILAFISITMLFLWIILQGIVIIKEVINELKEGETE